MNHNGLPPNWKHSTIGEIARVKTGKTPSRTNPGNFGGDIPWVKTAEVTDSVIRTTEEHLSEQGKEESRSEVFPAGSILVALYGQGQTRGRTAMLGVPAATNQACAVILPTSKADQQFLWWWLRASYVPLRDMGRGGNQPNLNLEMVRNFGIPIPPLPEQRRIAAVLDKADAIRRKRGEGIRLTEELLRSTFLEMFGDPAANPKAWQTGTVEEGLSGERPGMRCGPFGTALRKEEYVAEGIPVWGIENVQPNVFVEAGSLFITEDKYSELAAYSVRSGDVLISRAGTVGRMCVARPQQMDSIIGTNLIRVALDQSVISPDYFTALFSFFAERVGGLRASSDEGAYSFMQTGVLRQVKIPLPPIGKQEAFAEFVQVTRKNQTRRNEGLNESDMLFHALVQRAFRGEL